MAKRRAIGAIVLFILTVLFNILLGQTTSAFVYATISAFIGFIIGSIIGMIFSRKYWLKAGSFDALFGFLIWFYDYDFLLNMGGPDTPISDSINRLFFGHSSNGGPFFHYFS